MRLTDQQLTDLDTYTSLDGEGRTAEIERDVLSAIVDEVRKHRASDQQLPGIVYAVLSESTRLSNADALALTAEICRRLVA